MFRQSSCRITDEFRRSVRLDLQIPSLDHLQLEKVQLSGLVPSLVNFNLIQIFDLLFHHAAILGPVEATINDAIMNRQAANRRN